MLYQVGPLTFDTFPFSLDGVKRTTNGDFAKHPLLNRRRGYEAVGPGDDVLKLSGEFLPHRIGGLSEIETAHHLCAAQAPVFVMRGDGGVAGWHVVISVEEDHKHIMPNGVGFVVKHEVVLERTDDPGADAGAATISALLDLFG